ncbi:MAG: type III secretion system chaperone, partial [Ramlibacter sp.]
MNTVRFLHDWPQLLESLASDLGVNGYRSGPLWFTPDNGPNIVIEPLDGGACLALHANLGQPPHRDEDDDITGAHLAAFLTANAAAHDDDDGVYALDPVDDSLLLFRRFDDAGRLSYEDLLAQIRRFAHSARAAKEALPGV